MPRRVRSKRGTGGACFEARKGSHLSMRGVRGRLKNWTHQKTIFQGRLPGTHKDPFDHLLAAQAIVEDLAIMTIDGRIADLGARVVW